MTNNCSDFLSKPMPEILTDYTRKVDFLKGLLEAERLVSYYNNLSMRIVNYIIFTVYTQFFFNFLWSCIQYLCLVMYKCFFSSLLVIAVSSREIFSQSVSGSWTHANNIQWENTSQQDSSYTEQSTMCWRDEEGTDEQSMTLVLF